MLFVFVCVIVEFAEMVMGCRIAEARGLTYVNGPETVPSQHWLLREKREDVGVPHLVFRP